MYTNGCLGEDDSNCGFLSSDDAVEVFLLYCILCELDDIHNDELSLPEELLSG